MRISLFILIIATFVTIIDFALAALLPAIHKELGAFISLIVVNCLILGRQEAFASKNKMGLSIMDALGMSTGFTLALVIDWRGARNFWQWLINGDFSSLVIILNLG